MALQELVYWGAVGTMVLMSIIGSTLVAWRILLNFRARTDMNAFLPAFQNQLKKAGPDGAIKFCRSQTGVIPTQLFVAGLEMSKQGLAAMRRAMANAVELEIIPRLNFLLPTILAIAKIATMMGLLGTVVGMIFTFQEIERLQSTGQNIASQSGSIGLALVTTALGLITAIPLVFAHTLFKAWIHSFELRMKSAAQKLLVLMQKTQ